MEIIRRLKRRSFVGPFLFLLGVVNSACAMGGIANRAAIQPGSGASSDLTLALQIIFALVGLVGAVVTMLAGLTKPREALARHDLIERVEAVESGQANLSGRFDEHLKSHEKLDGWIKSLSDNSGVMRQDLSRTMGEVVEQREVLNEMLRLLRAKT